ncbi:MAG: hypothetical protein AAGF85_03140 [Bacteroidota bacterium]
MEENLFAIGMHNKASLEEYEQAFDKLVKSQELQFGGQVRAMYAFEKQICLAFIQIDLVFGAFISGFLITVLVFIYGVISGLF